MDWQTFGAAFWNAQISPGEALLRLAAAGLLSGAIGFEREAKGRAAGLRTHMLVGVASALFTIIAIEMFHWVRALEERPTADPLRLTEAITAGVAFLAAGSIFRSGADVKGVTTGAGLWLSGAIGLAAGQGYFGLAAVAAVIALAILAVIRRLEPR